MPAQEPTIILADEPTGNLDSVTSEEITAVFDVLHTEGQTIIIVSHEEHIARHCRRVIRLTHGKIVSDIVNERPDAATTAPLTGATQEAASL